ncbi:MAG: DUF3341 domain-containing protein [Caldilineaceae bacterium]|nr:DUF3341 domain-containing protein [Caldilineaceae bacterium]
MYGLVAEFHDEHLLLEAAREVKAAGYEKVRAYSSYPVHGLSDVLGHSAKPLRWLIFAAILVGGAAGFLLQYATAIYGYQLNVGGRPLNSWPTFIPVSFEVAVLVAALTAVVGMLLWNGLPLPYHPIFNTPGFELASGEKFYLCIEVSDARFNLQRTKTFLQDLGPAVVNEVPS